MPAAHANIGKVTQNRGVSEVVKNSSRVPTRPQLPIAKLDRVQTGNGRVEITFIDDSTVKVTEHSKLVIDDFVYSGKPSTSRMALKFAAGTARFATGQSGKMNKGNINLRTPTATIAVRGTDFAATVDDFGKSLIMLLPEPDGSVGEITVSNAGFTPARTAPHCHRNGPPNLCAGARINFTAAVNCAARMPCAYPRSWSSPINVKSACVLRANSSTIARR